MLKLFQREECPACASVRAVMASLNLSFETAFVPRLGSQRRELLALDGIDNPEVPVLVDDGRAIQGSEAIIEHLKNKHQENAFGDPRYGLTRVLSGVPFSDAIGLVKESLATEGFGVLTEIDVKATLKKKLDVDLNNYVILGACNPPLAHQALLAEPALGLFLPCNVVVSENQDGDAIVSTIDPRPMFGMLNNPQVETVADEVRKKLSNVLGKLETQ